MKYFVSIAASDSSTGAGIQQDNRIAESLGFHPLNIVTAITTQTFDKVYEVFNLDNEAFRSQLNITVTKFFPLEVCKIGVLTTSEQIDVLSRYLQNEVFEITVVDPVFQSSSGWKFLDESLIPIFKENILPYISFLTPNKFELESLCNKKITSFKQAVNEAMNLHWEFGCGIYIKGGHFNINQQQITEALIYDKQVQYIEKKREKLSFSHGTGCAFSTAFACLLARYNDPLQAAQQATDLVSRYFVEKSKSF